MADVTMAMRAGGAIGCRSQIWSDRRRRRQFIECEGMGKQQKYFWEDIKTGERENIGSVVVDRDEVIEFATRYDPQPFHVDEQAAKQSIYGGLIASGWHTCAMVMRLMCDAYLLESASLGSPGLENVRWLKPVRPGDTLTAYRTTLETRMSSSRPDRGIVKTQWDVENQNGDLVLTMSGINFFLKREPGNLEGKSTRS
jgi:acyl dehydratase